MVDCFVKYLRKPPSLPPSQGIRFTDGSASAPNMEAASQTDGRSAGNRNAVFEVELIVLRSDSPPEVPHPPTVIITANSELCLWTVYFGGDLSAKVKPGQDHTSCTKRHAFLIKIFGILK
ncbi:hypothetical protein PO909_024111 [Leuciscus waleckii]